MQAMEMAVNALDPWLPRRILTDVKVRWVRVERGVLTLQAEITRLRAGLESLCDCPADGTVLCAAHRVLVGDEVV